MILWRTIIPTGPTFTFSMIIDLSKNRKEQERTRLDKEIALFNKKMILYLYFSYTDNISCYGLIINEYDITDDK